MGTITYQPGTEICNNVRNIDVTHDIEEKVDKIRTDKY